MRHIADVIIPATGKPEVEHVVRHLSGFLETINQIIIVDFDRNAPSLDAPKVDSFRRSGVPLKYIYVEKEAYFNKAKALNIGVSAASAPLIIICDADVLLDGAFVSIASRVASESPSEKVFYTPEYVIESETGEKRPAPGICLLKRRDYLAINGYCNEYRGWGMEDIDFLKRLQNASIRRLKASFGFHLSHPDVNRTRNYHSESIPQMRLDNRALFAEKIDCNRLYGTLNTDITCCNYTE